MWNLYIGLHITQLRVEPKCTIAFALHTGCALPFTVPVAMALALAEQAHHGTCWPSKGGGSELCQRSLKEVHFATI